MSDSELRATVRTEFYRDRFDFVLLVLGGMVIVLSLLIGIAVYLCFDQPHPITIQTVDNEWRVRASPPLDQPSLSEADLLQWVSDFFPKTFTCDFLRVDQQLESMKKYYTVEGFKVFLMQFNNLISMDKLKSNKLFVTSFPARAPFIEETGLFQGRRAWRIQIPLKMRVVGGQGGSVKTVTFRVTVVRIPTTGNLSGVAINNVVVISKTEEMA